MDLPRGSARRSWTPPIVCCQCGALTHSYSSFLRRKRCELLPMWRTLSARHNTYAPQALQFSAACSIAQLVVVYLRCCSRPVRDLAAPPDPRGARMDRSSTGIVHPSVRPRARLPSVEGGDRLLPRLVRQPRHWTSDAHLLPILYTHAAAVRAYEVRQPILPFPPPKRTGQSQSASSSGPSAARRRSSRTSSASS